VLARLPEALRVQVEPEAAMAAVSEIIADCVIPELAEGFGLPGFDQSLAELIEKAERESARWEARVSREASRQLATHRRNELARNLKALAMGSSPRLAEDECKAEAWVGIVLDALGAPYPDPGAHRTAFHRMFALQSSRPAHKH